MCTGLEALAAFSAAASVGSSIAASQKSGPDPAAERAKAEAEATQAANGKISMQRKAMRENSLLTGGGGATLGAGAPARAQGRATLGV